MGSKGLRDFLASYPFPAFCLSLSDGPQPISLLPVYTNLSYNELMPTTNTVTGSWVRALRSVEEAKNFTVWLGSHPSSPESEASTYTVTLHLDWTETVVKLQLCKTITENLCVITSTPTTPLPLPSPPPPPKTLISRRGSPDMKIPDFPHSNGIHQSHIKPQASKGPIPRPPNDPEMARLLKTFPWEKTPLGPRDNWPQSYKTAFSIMWENPFPCACWLGKDLVFAYNAPYALTIGNKHPHSFGQHGAVAFAEVWDQMGPLAASLQQGGAAFGKLDDLFFLSQLTSALLPKEVYHSWSWIPFMGEDGEFAGIINPTIETTSKVVAERRLRALRHLAEKTSIAGSTQGYISGILDVMSDFPYEAPFLALYSCTENHHIETETPRIEGGQTRTPVIVHFTLRGRLGVPESVGTQSHPLLPRQFHLQLDPVGRWASTDSGSQTGTGLGTPTLAPADTASFPLAPLHESTALLDSEMSTPTADSNRTPSASNVLQHTHGAIPSPGSIFSDQETITPGSLQTIISQASSFDWSPWILEAFREHKPVFVENLPVGMMDDIGRDRGWGDRVRDAILIPIAAEGQELDEAVLILGMSTRAELDDEYLEWLNILRLTLSSSLTAVLGREAETIRADQLAQLDDAKTSFFANASHELRTPLTLIAGPIADALTITTDKKVREHLTLASRNAVRLTRLVDGLLDFSKIEGGKLAGSFTPVNLGAMVVDLASLFRSTVEKTGIQYIVECDVSDDNNKVWVDPDLFEKITLNLISNAFKYTYSGYIAVRLVIDSQWATLFVEDSGVGIPPQDLDKVFERFHRVDVTSRVAEGTGIGLALTRELVRLHSGTLTVRSIVASSDSDPIHGSTFCARFPLGKSHLPQANLKGQAGDVALLGRYGRGMVEEVSHWVKNSDVTTPSDDSSTSGMATMDLAPSFFAKSDLILLVDDNADMRQYIRSIFAPYSTVMEAGDGQEALNILEGGVRPALIISDVTMPVLDGFGLLSVIRGRPDLRLLPIILVTAQAGDEASTGGLLAGADDYLPKPFTTRQLLLRAHLVAQLGKKRAEMEAMFEMRTRELRILSEISPVGIFRADEHRRITWVNAKYYEISGLPEGQDPNLWGEYLSLEALEPITAQWNEIYDSGKGGVMTCTWKNGVICQANIEVLWDSQGRMGTMGTLTDVTELQSLQAAQLAHAEEREHAARRKAEEADERRRHQELLIDVTSHELRQPVSSIIQNAELVRSNLVELCDQLKLCSRTGTPFSPSETMLTTIDEDVTALEAIWQSGLAQERIANDVLSLSRIQLEVLSIIPVEFVPADELRRIVSLFHNELRLKNVRLDLQFGQSLEHLGIRHVRLDKFTDLTSFDREIRVSLDVSLTPPQSTTCKVPPLSPAPAGPIQKVYIYMSVKDSGPGLKPEDLALLFQRFSQGSNSHEVFGGSGLGLFVSRKLCELMGGRIEVVSEYGQGAMFRFYLKAEVPPSSAPLLADLPPPLAVLESSKSLRVLIVEDNQINQTVLNRQLKKANCRTALASNGVEALNAVQTSTDDPFDVILMDCEMPVMNGYVAARQLRTLESSKQLSMRNYVIALTGNAREQQIQSALDAGMDEVMIKPYRINELLDRIRRGAHREQHNDSLS